MTNLTEVLKDPSWLPFQMDANWRQLEFARVADEALRSAAFLYAGFSGAIKERASFQLSEVLACDAEAGPHSAAVILHSAFCCSTLMARACDTPGKCLSLKEPDILMSLANAKRMLPRQNRESEFADLFKLILKLLSRRRHPTEKILLKPTNAANNLLPDFLAAASPLILMYSDLEGFLVSVLKKGEPGRNFVRVQYNIFSLDEESIAQIPQRQAMTFTDLQVAALVWKHQLGLFGRYLSHHPSKMRSLKDSSFLADKGAALRSASQHLGLGLSEGEIAAALSGPVFKRNSKFDASGFDSTQKIVEAEKIRDIYASDIGATLEWAETVDLGEKLLLPLPQPIV